jgi:predicted RNase H-like nuclease
VKEHTFATVNVIAHDARIAGVDGCRGGWVVASHHECRIVQHLDDIVDRFDLIGIDMPIGLPERGPRSCDVEARRLLTPRGSTVFPTPPRSLLVHHDYATANAASKAEFGVGLSRQAFGLFRKIREVDAFARRSPEQFVEIHPECAFSRMEGRVLGPKRSAAGCAERLSLVERRFGAIEIHMRGAAADDVLDAYAVLWSAMRYAENEHVELGDGARDHYGLPMRIVS